MYCVEASNWQTKVLSSFLAVRRMAHRPSQNIFRAAAISTIATSAASSNYPA